MGNRDALFGIYFVQSRKLKCSLDAAKRGFYRAANLVRLDELRLKKSFYKLFQANVCQS